MIIQEHFTINEVDFVRSYSDKGVKIHGGMPEADYDVVEELAIFGRTYTETDIPIDDDVTAEEAVSILLGGVL